MTSQIRRSSESVNTIDNERLRSSVFDRLSSKQISSNQSHQFKNYHLHKKSSKYENMEYSSSKLLNENSKLNLDLRRRIGGQYNHSKVNHENNLSSENIYYKSSSKNIHTEQSDNIACNSKHSNRHLIQTEIIKDDIQNIKSSHLSEKTHKIYKESDVYKKHYHDQGAEVLEKKRIQLTRKLQMIDQKDKKLIAHHHKSRQSAYKSPCSNSSHSICSSSGSSDSGSYSGSSASCTNSSCSSSSYSEDDRLAHVSNCRSKKSPFSHHRRYMKHFLQEDIPLEHSHLQKPQTPPTIIKSSKRYKVEAHTSPPNNYQVGISSRRIRSKSLQSTNSSYYSRKSRGLTPPLHLQHSASPSIASASHSVKTENLKLDRHGNIRVSLKEKERQRRMVETQQQSIPNSSPSYSFQNQIYSKSRSPVSRSTRDEYYSSEEKRRYKESAYYNRESPIISPVNRLEYNQRKLKNYCNEEYQSRDYEEKFHRHEEKTFVYKSGSNYKQRDVLANDYVEDNYNLNDNRLSLYPKTPPLPNHKEYENKTRKYLNEDYNKHDLYNSENNRKNSEIRQFSSIEEPILSEVSRYSDESFLSYTQQKQKNYNSNKYKIYLSSSKAYSKSPEIKNISTIKKSANLLTKTSNANQSNFIQKESSCSTELINSSKSENIKLESKLEDHIDEISSISNNSLDDFDLLENKSLSEHDEKMENEECTKIDRIEEKIDYLEKEKVQNLTNFDLKQQPVLKSVNEEEGEEEEEEEEEEENSVNKNIKNEEIVSDENFSDWSDIEDYDNLINNDELEQKSESDKFIYDIKFKVDEELEAISDDEFDAIIDEQELENEKKGILSCKKVLDQLDIDWESLKQTNEDKYHPMMNSSLQQFKPANLLAQIGISQKYAGKELSQKILNYCREQLKDDNFNFESPIATYHYMFLRNRKQFELLSRNLDLQKSLKNNSTENSSSVELRKFLSNGNLIIRNSFNHLLEKLSKKTLKFKKENPYLKNISKQTESEIENANKDEQNDENPSNLISNKSNEDQKLDLKLQQPMNLQLTTDEHAAIEQTNENNLNDKLVEFTISEKKQ